MSVKAAKPAARRREMQKKSGFVESLVHFVLLCGSMFLKEKVNRV